VLTDEDKEHIYQEEVYRREVRDLLDKTNSLKAKKGGKVWALVNSAFFLWFLSSVVLGIISFLYARWDKQRAFEREQRERAAIVERENIQTARKLDAEISSRLTYFVTSQEIMLTKYLDNTYDIGARLSEEGIKSLDDPDAPGYKIYVYPEYANRSLRSLLLELKEVVPQQDRSEIDLVYNQSVKLQPIFIAALRMISELKKSGKPTYIEVGKSHDFYDELSPLREFCKSSNLKRWGEPVPSEEEIHVGN
jgi:hypothetical protein